MPQLTILFLFAVKFAMQSLISEMICRKQSYLYATSASTSKKWKNILFHKLKNCHQISAQSYQYSFFYDLQTNFKLQMFELSYFCICFFTQRSKRIIIIRQAFSRHSMQYINTRPLTFIVHRIQHSSRVATVFQEINQSCHLNLKFECPQNVLIMAKRINQRQVHEKKYKPSSDNNSNINWVFGEFKIFIWAIVYKCLINGLQIQQLTLDIIKEIQNIFKSKSLCFIQYEIQLLINQKYEAINDNWAEDQIQIFTEIMKELISKSNINWRIASFELFQRSNAQYFRNINHCREKWFNHLNPQVKKGGWTIKQDIHIFHLINEYGFKWSQISKTLDKTRTQHMIKNRFHKYFRQWKLAKNTPKQTIFRIFREKIQKPYIRKQMYSKLHSKDIKIEENDFVLVQELSSYRPDLPYEPFIDSNHSQNHLKVEIVQEPKASEAQPYNQIAPEHNNCIKTQEQPYKNEVNDKEQSIKEVSQDNPIVSNEQIVKTEPDNQQPLIETINLQEDSLPTRLWNKHWNYFPFMNMYYSQPYPFPY